MASEVSKSHDGGGGRMSADHGRSRQWCTRYEVRSHNRTL